MNPSGDPTHNPWAQFPSRPSSNVSYNHFGHSNSNTPTHGAHGMPQHPSPHGPSDNQLSERQRRVYELTYHNRQNVASHAATNGSGPRPPFTFAAPHPFHAQSIPSLPPPDGLHGEPQRLAHKYLAELDADKKRVLAARKETAAKLKQLKQQLASLEANQRHQELLRFIYPLQADIAEMEEIHDQYGREWDIVEELQETCWSEMMVPSRS
ncbi:MAG: hypothetical protein Q9181_006145 [Wetmoreana brouardii]